MSQRGHKEEKIRKELISAALAMVGTANPSDDTEYIKAKEIVEFAEGMPLEWPLRKKVALTLYRLNKPLFYLVCRIYTRMKKIL